MINNITIHSGNIMEVTMDIKTNNVTESILALKRYVASNDLTITSYVLPLSKITSV